MRQWCRPLKSLIMIQFDKVQRAGLGEIFRNNLVSDMGFVIGRANSRYTLWRYMREAKEDGSVYLNIQYLQVLSPNKDKVLQRFPGVFICEELRAGMGKEIKVVIKAAVKSAPAPAKAPKTLADYESLPFGKYGGVSFKEVNDASYWAYLANRSCVWQDGDSEIDFRPIIEERCYELGCYKMFDRWYAPAHENDRPWVKVAREILPLIEDGDPFSFVAEKNDYNFWYGIDIQFKDEFKYEFYTYYGGGRFLKVADKKGNMKNKRTKGKKIEVLEYEVLYDAKKPYVLVSKFNLV